MKRIVLECDWCGKEVLSLRNIWVKQRWDICDSCFSELIDFLDIEDGPSEVPEEEKGKIAESADTKSRKNQRGFSGVQDINLYEQEG